MQADFYKSLYSSRTDKSSEDIDEYLQNIQTPTLSEAEKKQVHRPGTAYEKKRYGWDEEEGKHGAVEE